MRPFYELETSGAAKSPDPNRTHRGSGIYNRISVSGAQTQVDMHRPVPVWLSVFAG